MRRQPRRSVLSDPTGSPAPSRLRLPCLAADGFASRRDFLNRLLEAAASPSGTHGRSPEEIATWRSMVAGTEANRPDADRADRSGRPGGSSTGTAPPGAPRPRTRQFYRETPPRRPRPRSWRSSPPRPGATAVGPRRSRTGPARGEPAHSCRPSSRRSDPTSKRSRSSRRCSQFSIERSSTSTARRPSAVAPASRGVRPSRAGSCVSGHVA